MFEVVIVQVGLIEAEFAMCKKCGSLVIAKKQHIKWHRENLLSHYNSLDAMDRLEKM